MSVRSLELVVGPIRAVRRAAILWAASLAGIVAVTVAVWPAFKGSSGISQAMDQLPAGVVQAFGLEGFDTPAGFLRGNLYDFFVPLLLAGAAIGFVNSLTSSEEDAGRLEVVLSQPVARQAVFAGRALAALAWTVLLSLAIAAAQFGTDALVNLDIGADRLVATLLLCWLIALLHGGLALAVAGVWPRPSLVIGVCLFVLVGGCIAEALFPLSPSLAELAHLSPWDWAFAGDPLVNATDAWRYLALGLPAVGLAVLGIWAFGRRDVQAA
jgi:ABC-2 type transport system permease protein